MPKPLWTPNNELIANANITKFGKTLEKQWSVNLKDSSQLIQFSIDEREKFWLSLKDFAGFIAAT